MEGSKKLTERDEYVSPRSRKVAPSQVPMHYFDAELLGRDKWLETGIGNTPISTGTLQRLGNPTLPYPSTLVSTKVLEYVYGKCKSTSVYIPVEIWRDIKTRCQELDVNISFVLTQLLVQWLGGSLRVNTMRNPAKLEELLSTSNPKYSPPRPTAEKPVRIVDPFMVCRKTKKRIKVDSCASCENKWLRHGCVYPNTGDFMEKEYQRLHLWGKNECEEGDQVRREVGL